MRRFITITAIAVCLLMQCLSGAAIGASFAPKDLEQLTSDSDTIVVGRVTEQTPRRLSSGLIVTDFVVEVEQRIKGTGKGLIERVTMAGGTIGAESQEVAGFPRPVAGGRYVLFISPQRTSFVPFSGGPQGIYRIETNPATQEELVFDAEGKPIETKVARMISRDASSATAEDSSQSRLKLRDFVSNIQRLLER